MRREYKVRVWRCIAFVGLFLCFLLGLGVGAYAQNANDILGKAAAAYENSNGNKCFFYDVYPFCRSECGREF